MVNFGILFLSLFCICYVPVLSWGSKCGFTLGECKTDEECKKMYESEKCTICQEQTCVSALACGDHCILTDCSRPGGTNKCICNVSSENYPTCIDPTAKCGGKCVEGDWRFQCGFDCPICLGVNLNEGETVGVCVKKRKCKESCIKDSDCDENTGCKDCIDGLCSFPSKCGGNCTINSDCVDEKCRACVGGKCATPLSCGATCQGSNECCEDCADCIGDEEETCGNCGESRCDSGQMCPMGCMCPRPNSNCIGGR